MKENLTVGGVIIALVLGGLAFLNSPDEVVVEKTTERVIEEVGAFSGPDIFSHLILHEGYTNSGDSVATSSIGNAIITSDLLANKVNLLTWLVNVNTTATTMASTSEPFISMKVGESREILLYNSTSTAAATLTFAAGTGVDLQEDEGGTVVVNGLETARLTFFKKADTDIAFIVEPYQVGD